MNPSLTPTPSPISPCLCPLQHPTQVYRHGARFVLLPAPFSPRLPQTSTVYPAACPGNLLNPFPTFVLRENRPAGKSTVHDMVVPWYSMGNYASLTLLLACLNFRYLPAQSLAHVRTDNTVESARLRCRRIQTNPRGKHRRLSSAALSLLKGRFEATSWAITQQLKPDTVSDSVPKIIQENNLLEKPVPEPFPEAEDEECERVCGRCERVQFPSLPRSKIGQRRGQFTDRPLNKPCGPRN